MMEGGYIGKCVVGELEKGRCGDIMRVVVVWEECREK